MLLYEDKSLKNSDQAQISWDEGLPKKNKNKKNKKKRKNQTF